MHRHHGPRVRGGMPGRLHLRGCPLALHPPRRVRGLRGVRAGLPGRGDLLRGRPAVRPRAVQGRQHTVLRRGAAQPGRAARLSRRRRQDRRHRCRYRARRRLPEPRAGHATPTAVLASSAPYTLASRGPGSLPDRRLVRPGRLAGERRRGPVLATEFPRRNGHCRGGGRAGTGSGLTSGDHSRATEGGPRPLRREKAQKAPSATAPSAATASVVASPLCGSCSS